MSDTTLTREGAEEYTQSLSQIFAGSYRQILWAQQQGIPEALGLTTGEWVTERLGGYVKMQIPERRQAVAELTKEGLSARKVAEVVGVDHATAARDVVANATPEIKPEAKTKTRKQRDLKAEAKREDRATRALAVANATPEPDIRHGTLSEALADVTEVDLVFTDPPYPREFLPAWSELGTWARRALKPGALLVAYSGQYHLPDVLARLSDSLNYQWLGWLSTKGPQVAVHQRPIMSGGKPLLIFSNGPLAEPYRSRRFFDSIDSEGRTRELHTWEQAEGPAAYYIEALTERGELVVDPFLGSGTFAFVARELDRRFIGCDSDVDAISVVRERLAA